MTAWPMQGAACAVGVVLRVSGGFSKSVRLTSHLDTYPNK